MKTKKLTFEELQRVEGGNLEDLNMIVDGLLEWHLNNLLKVILKVFMLCI